MPLSSTGKLGGSSRTHKQGAGNLAPGLPLKDLMQAATGEVTQLLVNFSNGDKGALEALLPLVSQELRSLARVYLTLENASPALQPTALVQEAYLRLVDQQVAQWRNRAHFFGVAASLMRKILVEQARLKAQQRKSERPAAGSMDSALEWSGDEGVSDLVALDSALKTLCDDQPRQSRIVELRYFGGLNMEETAAVLGTTPELIRGEWEKARAWLTHRMREGN